MPGFKFQGVYPRKNLVVRTPCFSASYPQGVRVPPVKNHWLRAMQHLGCNNKSLPYTAGLSIAASTSSSDIASNSVRTPKRCCTQLNMLNAFFQDIVQSITFIKVLNLNSCFPVIVLTALPSLKCFLRLCRTTRRVSLLDITAISATARPFLLLPSHEPLALWLRDMFRKVLVCK